MRLRAVFAVVASAAVMASLPAYAVPGGSGGSGPPLIPGSRQVHIRNGSGGMGVHTSIPGGSVFLSHGGGASAECEGIAAGDDPDTLDVVEEVRPVRSTKWIFIEGASVEIPLPVNLEAFDPDGAASLEDRTRTFSVHCADTFYASNFLGFVDVGGD